MLNETLVQRVLQAALSEGGDFAELFVENKIIQNISMVGGKVDKARSGRDYGIGIRIFNGLDYLYTYTNNDSEDHLIEIATLLSQTLKSGHNKNQIIHFQK